MAADEQQGGRSGVNSRQRRVAEVVHLQGCLRLRQRARPTVDVLTAADAAALVLQDGAPGILWLDVAAEALFITQRWGAEVAKQRLPLKLDVAPLASPVQVAPEEVAVATVAFPDGPSLQHFLRLVQVLRSWLHIRQGAAGRSLLLGAGLPWLADYQGTALRLRSQCSSCSGLLQLDLRTPRIELRIMRGAAPVRLEAVNSLCDATKALAGHSKACLQPLHRGVEQRIRGLQPTEELLLKLKQELQASASSRPSAAAAAPHGAAADMPAWLRGGVVAALVDCAAAWGVQQHDSRPSPSDLQLVADCICIVLRHAGSESEQQTELLVACISRSLCGTSTQALPVVRVLSLLLQANSHAGSLTAPLLQACQHPALMQALVFRYGASMPGRGCFSSHSAAAGLRSHPLPAPCSILLRGTAEVASINAAAAAAQHHGSPCTQPGSTSLRPLVPRLSLPSGAGTPLPCAGLMSSRVALQQAGATSVANDDYASDQAAQEPGASNGHCRMAALQQLAYSCGESMMAADLAAFVVQKQLHACHATQGWHSQPAQPVSGQEHSGVWGTADRPKVEQLCGPAVPLQLQLQLRVLACLDVLLHPRLPACCVVVAPLANVLMAQLLPQQYVLKDLDGCEGGLVRAIKWQRDTTLQLVARCSEFHVASDAPGCRLHAGVLAQFEQQLQDSCRIVRPDAATHATCRGLLLLLRDYLRCCQSPWVADTACSVLGVALAQQEHLLRGSRVCLWGWPAVQHMDALVQVYAELAAQARGPAATEFLLETLGCKAAGSPAAQHAVQTSSMAGVPGSASPAMAADSLQLVLDFLQQRLTGVQPTSCSSQCGDSGAAESGSERSACTRAAAAQASGCAPRPPAHATDYAGVEAVAGIKESCWRLLTGLLRLSSAGTDAHELHMLLVDLLVRQRGGRAYVLQQLEELDGSQAMLPLQLQLLEFLAAALALPGDYAASVPQLLEFYAHHHFLHFTRHYHKLATSANAARAAACCKGHVKVLLALSQCVGGSHLVRRRFLQLRVLDFLAHELSLEHTLHCQQHQASDSCSSTPLSTARAASSSVAVGVPACASRPSERARMRAAPHADGHAATSRLVLAAPHQHQDLAASTRGGTQRQEHGLNPGGEVGSSTAPPAVLPACRAEAGTAPTTPRSSRRLAGKPAVTLVAGGAAVSTQHPVEGQASTSLASSAVPACSAATVKAAAVSSYAASPADLPWGAPASGGGSAVEDGGASLDPGYQPGWDLEEDFEHLLAAEESGEHATWALSDRGSSTSDGSSSSRSSNDGSSDNSSSSGSSKWMAGGADVATREAAAASDNAVQRQHREWQASGAAWVDGVLGLMGRACAAAAAGDAAVSTSSDGRDASTAQCVSLAGSYSSEDLSLSGDADSPSLRRAPKCHQVPQLVLTQLHSSPALVASGHSSSSGAQHASRPAVPSLMAVAAPLATGRPAVTQQAGTADGKRTAAPCLATGPLLGALDTYRARRRSHAVYADEELHVLCLELALSLLIAPSGLLDPLQLPQDPTDGRLETMCLVLLHHLSHDDNKSAVDMLTARAQQGLHAASAATMRLLRLLVQGMPAAGSLQLGGMVHKGAVCAVYAGTLLLPEGTPVPVAVKVLECVGDGLCCFERVYNEVAVLEQLQHQPDVIGLLQYRLLRGGSSSMEAAAAERGDIMAPQWALVFPRCAGSLKDWRSRHAQGLEPQHVPLYLGIFVQVARALAELHAQGVVHYDIKGDNVLLSDAPAYSTCGEPPFRVVLADFGDAMLLDGGASGLGQQHRGTELFSSPEMLLLRTGQRNPCHDSHDRRKHRGVGQPHDVWSLGCTLYELLTGQVLFEEEGVGRIMSYARTGAATAPARSAPAPARSAAAAESRCAVGRACCVLRQQEHESLGHHGGAIDLLEFMLVGDPAWRPTAAEVVLRAQRLLDRHTA